MRYKETDYSGQKVRQRYSLIKNPNFQMLIFTKTICMIAFFQIQNDQLGRLTLLH